MTEIAKTIKRKDQPVVYETIWRNKWITSDATSFDDMIAAHLGAIEELLNYKAHGVTADFQCASDDYIFLRTEDANVAAKFGFEEESWCDEEDDSDEEDEPEDLDETPGEQP